MKIILRLLGYGWRHRSYVLAAYLAMILATAAGLAMPWIIGTAIDEALETGVRSALFYLGALILVTGAARGLFAYWQSYLAEAISQKTAFEIRSDLFQKLASLSFGFHDRQNTGDLMSKVTADVEAVQRLLNTAFIRGVSMVATFLIIAIIMITTNWRLGVVTTLFAVPVLWRAMHMSRRLRSTWGAVQRETGNMTTVLQESIAGIKVVKAFGASDHVERQFANRSGAVRDLTYSATKQFVFHGSLMTFIFTCATGAVLWLGGHEIVNERLTAGELATFILYVGMMTMPVRMIGWMVNMFSRAHAAGKRIFDVLDSHSDVIDRPNAQRMGDVLGTVRFSNVSMSYQNTNTPAVDNVNFQVESGQMVALLGASGSGKSTLAHLIPRFYDVTDGSITIDGIDIRDVTLHSLRNKIGIVMQDIFVFGASIKDNISYGVKNASAEDIADAARVAQLHDFIEQTPMGYETWVGERGVRLSGGQRQRLSIARTILLDPPLLILDDSTSSVDTITEYQIQQSLNTIIEGRTTFVIAHRLSTVRQADLILVLEKGQVVEQGIHQDLIKSSGFYRKIHDLQLQPQEEQLAGP